jgi:squalene-associated FAD-dependent desaturase
VDALSCDVVVIGAGCAGLAAAVKLAAAGRKVVVVEQAPRLGGRATAFTDKETGDRVDNGQHVLFGCYRETYAFLSTIGAKDRAPLQPHLVVGMADETGRRTQLRCSGLLPPPWHLALGVLRWSALPLADRLSVLDLASVLRATRRDGASAVAARVPERQTVSDWLTEHGQTPRLCEWLWRPLAIAALNQSPDVAAAAPFVRVVGELFGPAVDDSAIGLPVVPLDALYAEPARAFIEARGGTVLQKLAARIDVSSSGDVAGVEAGGVRITTRHVVSSVPWHAFASLWAHGVPQALSGIAANAAAMESSPIVTVNLWFEQPVALGDVFVGLIGGPLQWVFDKTALYAHTAGHLAAVASGATELARLDNAGATRLALEQLTKALPMLAGQTLKRSVVVREPRATFSIAPGGPPRPGHRTPVSNFFLAGDWTDTGLPATIEGAVLSGHTAASAVLAS